MNNNLPELAKLIRYYILLQTNAAQSGHTTSSLSAVELMTVLYFKYLRFNLDEPKDLSNDRIIFSKGHASPLFYSLYAAAGKLTEEDLKGYRTINSVLEGHPSVRFPYTEALTGSLGQGLSIGVGMALGLQNKGYLNQKVYVLLGDGEMVEGQVWEAVQYASYHKLSNLIAIVDVNRLGQSQETMLGHDVAAYQRRLAAFGWRTYIVSDGHDLSMVENAYEKAVSESVSLGGPAVIIAKTIKGKGVSFWENENGWHSKVVPKEKYDLAIKGLGDIDHSLRGTVLEPVVSVKRESVNQQCPIYEVSYSANEKVSTKEAFGNALVRIGGCNKNLFVLDGDMKNSTTTDAFATAFPDRFLQLYIAEQNMISTAQGLSIVGYKPFVSTFACFLTRAHDQLRLASLSSTNILVNGAYGGVSLGKDGPSQMGIDDISMFRGFIGSTVLYPSDAYSAEALTEEATKQEGMVYLRTTREPLPILYSKSERFPIGGSKTLVASDHDLVTIVAAGITLFEALSAASVLKNNGIDVRVIDAYSIKPIDKEGIIKAASETKMIITVEDHYVTGGLGDAVIEALSEQKGVSVYKMGVTKIPRSGASIDVMEYENITSRAIIEKVKEVLKK